MSLKVEKTSKIVGVLAPAWALAIALHSACLHADNNVDSVCGSILSNPQASSNNPNAPDDPNAAAAQQKLQYCQAAKSAQDGANADSATYKVWGAVAVVCTHACTATMSGLPTNEYLCTGASVSGGATDAAVSKNFSNALTGLGGASAGLAANQANRANQANQADQASQPNAAATQGAEPAKKKADIGACVSAAAAAQQSVAKYKSMQNNNDTVNSNLASINSIQSPTQAGATADTSAPQQGSGAGGSSASGGDTGGGGLAAGGGASSSGPCAQPSSPGVTMQCAIASDRNLPAFVGNPNFAKEFQKDAGLPLNDFLSKDGSPAPMMAAGMTHGLNPAQSAKLDAALSDLAQNTDAAPSELVAQGMYSSGGGGGGGGEGEDPAAQMGAMVQDLMDKMNPNKKKEEQTTGVSAVIFANQTRSPAAVAEDRKLSIFDRITYRYYFVGRRIVMGEDEK